jgi:hypothetical protein
MSELDNSDKANDYYFDFYYRPYDEGMRGDYKKATVQAWSVYRQYQTFYRCKFYDAFNIENEPLTEGKKYDFILVVREGETQIGYAESEFTWTDSCAIFVEYAESHTEIEK